jgi:hypothetical protein
VTLSFDPKPTFQFNEKFSNNSNDYLFNATRCSIREKYADNTLASVLNTLVAGFLNLALPSVLTFIVNIAIVCYIKRIYKTQHAEPIQRRSEITETNYRSSRSTLLVISITYTLCYLPYCILNLLSIKFDSNSALAFGAEITSILRYISHSVNFYAYIFTNHRFRRDIILLLRLVYRPCSYMKKRKEHQEKTKRKSNNNIVFHHYRSVQSIPANNSSKMICVYQRPTCIRFQNQNNYARQQNLQTNEIFYNKQNTILATVTPSHSSEKYRNRIRV